MQLRLSLIVAMTRSGVIGRGGTLPWRLSADLRRFKALTMGHHLIMGRKTWDSLGRPLPGRISIVLKRHASPYDYAFADTSGNDKPLYDEVVASRRKGQPEPKEFVPVAFVRDFDAALDLAAGDDEVFVIGGGEIYRLALPLADRLYVTWVEADVAGDTFFPLWNPDEWLLVESQRHPADEKNEHDCTFAVYDRVR